MLSTSENFGTPEKIVKSFSVDSQSPPNHPVQFIEDKADRAAIYGSPVPLQKMTYSDQAQQRKQTDLDLIDDEIKDLKYVPLTMQISRDDIVNTVFTGPVQ